MRPELAALLSALEGRIPRPVEAEIRRAIEDLDRAAVQVEGAGLDAAALSRAIRDGHAGGRPDPTDGGLRRAGLLAGRLQRILEQFGKA